MGLPDHLRAALGDLESIPADGLPDVIGALEGAAARCWLRLGVERAQAQRPASGRQWIRLAEAAAEYGLARATLYDWSHTRKVKTKKMGSVKSAPVLFWRPDLERLARIRPALRTTLDEG